ncbi:TetR/AcrR family transcriptional regulator [Neisseriaceae bacterium CLB008]
MPAISPRQRLIIDAALPFIIMNPTATLNEIASAANISKATFHRHFDGRDTLFAAMAHYALQSLRTALDQLPSMADPEARLRAMIAACTAQGDKVYFLFYYPNNKAPQDFSARIQTHLAPYYDTLSTLYAQDYFNPKLPLDWLTNSLHTHLSIAWVQVHIGNVTLKEAIDLVWTHFCDGAKR